MTDFRWTAHDVAAALGLEPDPADRTVYPGVSTDTRTLKPGDLFVALRGDRFDAHEMLNEAATSGAAAAVVSREPHDVPAGLRLYRVADTLRALGALGHYRRQRTRAKVVGVVGSNGKTTTKDLIRAALSGRYAIHATQGNLNNQIGVPLTLLSAPDEAEVLVVEMGTNEPGEISILTDIVRPDVVVITSIGEEHLEKLGSLDGVLEEELSVLEGLAEDGIALVAEEPPALAERASARLAEERVRVAGVSSQADLRPEGGAEGIEVQPDGSTRWRWSGRDVALPLPGRFNVRNALLALGVALELGVDVDTALDGISRVASAKLRGEWHTIGSLRVLADCYNSNPPSVRGAIELLAGLPAGGRRVAVLGTMREMGARTAELHEAVAAEVADRLGDGIDLVVATGVFADAFAVVAGDDARVIRCHDPVEAYRLAAGRLDGDERILLKASRGEALERWLPLLRDEWERE